MLTKQITAWYVAAVLASGLLGEPALSQPEDSKETAKPEVIIGSTREKVDLLLKDWTIRQSARSTTSRPIIYYVKDVEVIVTFQGSKAVGVAVIDKPGIGISPIPQKRFIELVALIGGGQPEAKDILKDSSGIREFSLGDAD